MWCDNDTPWEEEETKSLRSGIFPTSSEQHKEAVAFLQHLVVVGDIKNKENNDDTRRKLHVRVDMASSTIFYRAEEYQQQYLKKQIVAAREQMISWANEQVPTALFTLLE